MQPPPPKWQPLHDPHTPSPAAYDVGSTSPVRTPPTSPPPAPRKGSPPAGRYDYLDELDPMPMLPALSQSSAGCSSRGPRLSSSSSNGCELKGLPQITEMNIENFFERLGDVGLPQEVYALFDGVRLPRPAHGTLVVLLCRSQVRSCTTSQSSGLTQQHLLHKSSAGQLNCPAQLAYLCLTYMAPARSAVVAPSNVNCHLWCLVLYHQALLMMTF